MRPDIHYNNIIDSDEARRAQAAADKAPETPADQINADEYYITQNYLKSGDVTGEFAYKLTTGSGVSEILALNNHEFLVDERDGKGRGDASNAAVKQLFKIDLNGAFDISGLDGVTAVTHAVAKTLFLDIVQSLVNAGMTPAQIPAKIEGISFGRDIEQKGTRLHTLWVGNDNDFLSTVLDHDGNTLQNPNQIFVFGFTDADLNGSELITQ